ncbi:hypothetical protein DL95DRAFT_457849 [Leptodontidium sp. 2 PMI_412]|nr:hypothetical protein DL95DRAFT_457849 [Leptodontidium sp. 2 PMI_412]
MAKNPNEIVRYTSICRVVEAAGGAIASGISSTSAPLTVAMGINFALWGVASVPAWFVVRKLDLPENEEGPSSSDVETYEGYMEALATYFEERR